MGERRREEKGGNYLVAALEIFFKVVIKNLKLKILIKIELKYINIKKKKKKYMLRVCLDPLNRLFNLIY